MEITSGVGRIKSIAGQHWTTTAGVSGFQNGRLETRHLKFGRMGEEGKGKKTVYNSACREGKHNKPTAVRG